MVFALTLLELLPTHTVVTLSAQLRTELFFISWASYFSGWGERRWQSASFPAEREVFPMVLLLKYSFASFIDLRKFFIYKKDISKPQTHLRNYKLPILAIFIVSFVIFEVFPQSTIPWNDVIM